MSQWNDPGKIEEAFAEVVGGLSLDIYSGDSPGESVTINTGQDSDDLELPSVVCAVQSGSEEFIRDTGNYQSTVLVRVSSSGTVTRGEHRARAATVFDAFMASDIKTTLNAAVDDFHVFHIVPHAPEPTRREPRGNEDGTFMLVSEMAFDIWWCGSSIA